MTEESNYHIYIAFPFFENSKISNLNNILSRASLHFWWTDRENRMNEYTKS